MSPAERLEVLCGCQRCAAVGRTGEANFEGEAVDEVGDTAEPIVLVARSGIDVDSYAGEVAGESFCGDTDAVGKFCDRVEFSGVLRNVRGNFFGEEGRRANS